MTTNACSLLRREGPLWLGCRGRGMVESTKQIPNVGQGLMRLVDAVSYGALSPIPESCAEERSLSPPDVLDVIIDMVNDQCNDSAMDEQWALGDAGPLGHAGQESHLLRDVVQTYQVLMAAFAHAVGTSAARLPLLRRLAVAGEQGVGTAALARALGVDASGVTRSLAALVADGLAERRPHSTDGRRALFLLTPEGRQGFEEFHERMHRFEAAACAGASPDDLRTTAEVLAAVREAVLAMDKT